MAREDFHASAGRPAFLQTWSRNVSRSHPYSTGTCGNSTPDLPNAEMSKPCLPMTTSSEAIGRRGDRTVISIVMRSISSFLNGGKRGSSNAAAYAISDTVVTKGSSLCMRPMQPLSEPASFSVTKAPQRKVVESVGASGLPW